MPFELTYADDNNQFLYYNNVSRSSPYCQTRATSIGNAGCQPFVVPYHQHVWSSRSGWLVPFLVTETMFGPLFRIRRRDQHSQLLSCTCQNEVLALASMAVHLYNFKPYSWDWYHHKQQDNVWLAGFVCSARWPWRFRCDFWCFWCWKITVMGHAMLIWFTKQLN